MTEAGNDPTYLRVERLHVRQWLLRGVVPLAAACAHFGPQVLPERPGGPALELGVRIAGLTLVLAAAAVRVLAKGVLVRKSVLTTAGIYGFLRHPFYFATLTGAVGTFLIAGIPGATLAALWLVFAVPVFAVTIRAEEAGLARLHPHEWDAYSRRVRALLPGVPPPSRHELRVTWGNLRAEREPPRLVRFLGGAALVTALTLPDPARRVVAAGAALAFGASYALRAPRARR